MSYAGEKCANQLAYSALGTEWKGPATTAGHVYRLCARNSTAYNTTKRVSMIPWTRKISGRPPVLRTHQLVIKNDMDITERVGGA